MSAAPNPAKIRPDWEAIRRDYRTGKFTLRELEGKYGPSNATIMRRAKREGWTQDLSEAVRQATNAALVQQVVQQTQQACSNAQQDAASTVLAAAEVNKQIILGHRKRARRAAEITANLLEELSRQEALSEHSELLAQIVAGEGAAPADVATARTAVQRALAVGSRAATVKTLTDALAKQAEMERAAYNLEPADAKPPEDSAPVDWARMDQAKCAEAIASMLRGGK